jgi:hypothetical protein
MFTVRELPIQSVTVAGGDRRMHPGSAPPVVTVDGPEARLLLDGHEVPVELVSVGCQACGGPVAALSVDVSALPHRDGGRMSRLPVEITQRAVNQPQTCRHCQMSSHIVRLGLLPRHRMPLRDAGDQRPISPADQRIAELEAKLTALQPAELPPPPALPADWRFDPGEVHASGAAFALFDKSHAMPANLIRSDWARAMIRDEIVAGHCRCEWLAGHDQAEDQADAARERGPLSSLAAQARLALEAGRGTVHSTKRLEYPSGITTATGTINVWTELDERGNRTLVYASPDDGVQLS